MGFFTRLLSGKPDANTPSLQPAFPGFSDYIEPYHRHWIRGSLPDPGGSIYAYDTLALMPMYPIDRFGQVQQPLRVTNGPLVYVLPAAVIDELPTPNGQLIMQPLYDPNA